VTQNTKTRRLLSFLGALATIACVGCGGPGNIRFDRERCYIDGQAVGLTQVEDREAVVEHRIAVRQPWLVVITVVVVLLAGIGYVEKLVLLLSANRDSKGMGEKLREAAERYRAHRLRYFMLVGGSVGLLVTAGSLYIYVDADKRASERALAALQFCHLALRTGEETSALDQQRQNLVSIHQTAGEIRQLIDKLPPAEQVKAQEIIGHMDDAVGRERRIITDQLQRSADTAEAIRDGTLSIEKSLTGLETAVGGLKDLPASVKALADVLHTTDARGSALQDRIAAMAAQMQTMEHAVDGLAARPPLTCPACVCGERARPDEPSRKSRAHDVASVAPEETAETAAAAADPQPGGERK
jgi:hypothetical protein